MYHNRTSIYYLTAIFFFAVQMTPSQTKTTLHKDLQVDAKTRTAVINSISELITQRYVFPDIALQVKDILATKLKNGAYDVLDDPVQFANALWADLQESSNDNHFFIEYNPERARLIIAKKSQSPEEIEKARKAFAEKSRLTNFGFKKLDIMKGNVGYLNLEYFADPDYAGATAVAAMNFLANSDAVIIDLRDTPGGEPTMVQLLCSYFIGASERGRTLLNTLEQVYDGKIEQFWTIPYVPGKHMYDTDLYVLTNEYTGSGAEEFTYNMKALNRATIIGEKTRGSAHDTDFEVIQENFVMHLPVRRPVNPITKTNWEHTGIEPHIAIPAEQALDKAYLMALEKILEKSRDDDQRFRAAWALDGVRAQIDPVKLDEASLKKYIGQYGERKITYENGDLFYQRTGPKYKLIPLRESLFAVESLDYFRIEMTLDKNGSVTGLVGLYDDGRKDPSQRTK